MPSCAAPQTAQREVEVAKRQQRETVELLAQMRERAERAEQAQSQTQSALEALRTTHADLERAYASMEKEWTKEREAFQLKLRKAVFLASSSAGGGTTAADRVQLLRRETLGMD